MDTVVRKSKEKPCPGCGRVFSLEWFGINGTTYRSRCKPCHNAQRRARRDRDPKKYDAYNNSRKPRKRRYSYDRRVYHQRHYAMNKGRWIQYQLRYKERHPEDRNKLYLQTTLLIFETLFGWISWRSQFGIPNYYDPLNIRSLQLLPCEKLEQAITHILLMK